MGAFTSFETETVTIKRLPVMSGTPPTRSGPATLATGVACSPFVPASTQLLARTKFEGPGWPMETYTEYAVQSGDEVVCGSDGLTYNVFYSAPWPWDADTTVYQVGIRKPFKG